MELIIEYNMALILNPSIILSTVMAQTVNEFIPSGVVLILLMFFVIISISLNVYIGVKRYRYETKMIKRERLQQNDIEQDNINTSAVS